MSFVNSAVQRSKTDRLRLSSKISDLLSVETECSHNCSLSISCTIIWTAHRFDRARDFASIISLGSVTVLDLCLYVTWVFWFSYMLHFLALYVRVWWGEVSLVRFESYLDDWPPTLVLWPCWLGHQTCKNIICELTYTVSRVMWSMNPKLNHTFRYSPAVI